MCAGQFQFVLEFHNGNNIKMTIMVHGNNIIFVGHIKSKRQILGRMVF